MFYVARIAGMLIVGAGFRFGNLSSLPINMLEFMLRKSGVQF